MRDLEVIDSELPLLLVIRHMVREEEGRPPSTARIDALLDERSATVLLKDGCSALTHGSELPTVSSWWSGEQDRA
jgi:hypothetical protein